MAGASGGALAAAISAAGGLGMIGAGNAVTPDWILEQGRIAAEGGKPYGVGLMAWALAERPGQLEAVLELKPALVAVSFGDYPQYVEPLKQAGIAVATQAGKLADAREAVAAGVDVLVARGGEGGGHGRNEVATLPLLQAVLDEVDVPVLAAGGISGARGMAAVLAAGAAGAWIGTAFLTCREAINSASARQQFVAADETSTAYGRVFDKASRAGWPDEFGGRALRNTFFEEWEGREAELGGDDAAHELFLAAMRAGDVDTTSLYAGQGVGALRSETTAAEVVRSFEGTEDLLRRALR
ncbi:NAD(P)H-dependent flavin oxidoreductase [Kribbella deserti]|uniref:NAD(P)H-dependent flavin oxidoreductase n=1 Tax=Kribbella deserti TaxID=1926257 RepID=A0ABV6QPS0_9ACTN